jgi:RNA polymerase sigma-70 factor (ECF subfamily)
MIMEIYADQTENMTHNDIEGFEKVVDLYKNRIYNFSLNLIGSREDAEELTSDVFYKFYRSMERFQNRSSVKTYLFSIARNCCIDHLRKNKHKTVSLEDAKEQAFIQKDVSEKIVSDEKKRVVLDAIKKLDIDHKEALILRELEELTYEEISGILKININTAKTRVRRAKEKLMESLSKTGGDLNG